MANQSAFQSERLRRGPWLEDEDRQLTMFVAHMGERKWDSIAKASGGHPIKDYSKPNTLNIEVSTIEPSKRKVHLVGIGLERSGKSCRFRWLNYLRPNLKRDRISSEEEDIILNLHEKWGNKWSRIARWLPGRTDNEIKNYWRSHLRKKFPIQLEECKVKQGKQDKLSLKKCAMGESPRHDNISHNQFGFSNLEITSSPYEVRLSNWISDQLGTDEKQEVNAERDDQADHFWDSLASLWDME